MAPKKGRAASSRVNIDSLFEALKAHKAYVLTLKQWPSFESRACKQKRIGKGGALYTALQELHPSLSFTKKVAQAAFMKLQDDQSWALPAAECLRKNLRFVSQALLKNPQPTWLRICLGKQPGVLEFGGAKRKSPEPSEEDQSDPGEDHESEAQEEDPCVDASDGGAAASASASAAGVMDVEAAGGREPKFAPTTKIQNSKKTLHCFMLFS